jgi:hypothetical protein
MSNFRSVTPVQQFDPTACWAASLEWWAKAIHDRTLITQLNLLVVYKDKWDSTNPETNPNYGTVSRANLISIFEDGRWRMTCEAISGTSFTCAHANKRMAKGPILVGYNKPGIGNHVVVVYGASETHIARMDPDGAQFVGSQAAHYQGGEVIIGYPS